MKRHQKRAPDWRPYKRVCTRSDQERWGVLAPLFDDGLAEMFLAQIASCLSIRDLYHLAMVNKTWRHRVWRYMAYGMDKSTFLGCCQRIREMSGRWRPPRTTSPVHCVFFGLRNTATEEGMGAVGLWDGNKAKGEIGSNKGIPINHLHFAIPDARPEGAFDTMWYFGPLLDDAAQIACARFTMDHLRSREPPVSPPC